MARIGIDCRFAGTGTGLARYTVEMTRALLAHDAEWTLFVRDAHEAWLRHLPGSPRVITAPYRHYSLGEHVRFPWLLGRSGIDILFVPHFNAPAICSVPVVITVHDLILHRYPNDASLFKRFLYRRVFERALHRSRAIIAVSTFVGEELQGLYPKTAPKTSIITEGVGDVFHPATESVIETMKRKHAISAPYFLYVGSAKEHKNVQMLIDAFHAANFSNVELLLVSGGSEVERLRLGQGVRRVRPSDDADLAALYTGAKAFVTASLYEGYCLPVAEALACGCPVIASNRAAIPETIGNRGLLLEPTVETFAEAFRKPPAPSAPTIVGDWNEAGRKTFDVLFDAIER